MNIRRYLTAAVTLWFAALPWGLLGETEQLPPSPLKAASISQQTITLANGEWPPYQSQHLKHYGVASHIATEAFKRMGITVEYDFLPWARAYVYAQQGRVSGSLIYTHSPQREKSFYFSDPLFQAQVVFFHRADTDLQWRSVADLKQLRIGVTAGSNYGEVFNKAVQLGELSVQSVHKDELNFYKLLGGRIDIFPINIDVGMAMSEALLTPAERDRLTYHPRPVFVAPLHVIMGRAVKENAELIQIFNQGLKALRDEGRYDLFVRQSRAGLYKQEPIASSP